MRKTWSDARDKHGLKKGAVSGVSVGDAIDKLDKAQAKGYASTLSAAATLEGVLDKYRGKIAKTNPDFAGWMDKNIKKDLKALMDGVKLDIASVNWINVNVLRETVVTVGNMFPDSGMLVNARKLMADTPPKTFPEARKILDIFIAVEKIAALVAKRATTMKTMKWQHPLPGHAAHYAVFGKYADAVVDDVKFVIQWSKAPDMDTHLDFMGKARSRVTYLDFHSEAQSAVKSLLG